MDVDDNMYNVEIILFIIATCIDSVLEHFVDDVGDKCELV